MSHMQQALRFPLFLATSDVHLSAKPPTPFATESDWLGYQASVLASLYQRDYEGRQFLGVLVAGDLFDTFDPGIAVVDLCFRNMSLPTYAIYGQHDLYYHQPKHLSRTAINFLDQHLGTFNLLTTPSKPLRIITEGIEINLIGIPFGQNLSSVTIPDTEGLRIVLVHQLCCLGNESYASCPSSVLAKDLNQFAGDFNVDLVLVGDNHVPFREGKVINCGSLLPRNWDETMYNHYYYEIYALKRDLGKVHLEIESVPMHYNISESPIASREGMSMTTVSDFLRELDQLVQSFGIGIDFLSHLGHIVLKSEDPKVLEWYRRMENDYRGVSAAKEKTR